MVADAYTVWSSWLQWRLFYRSLDNRPRIMSLYTEHLSGRNLHPHFDTK